MLFLLVKEFPSSLRFLKMLQLPKPSYLLSL